MGGEEDGRAGRRQVGDRTAQVAGGDGVDADGRLVEEEDVGAVEQTAGDVEALPHAARIALDPLLLPARQAHQVEEFGDAPLLLAGADPVQLGEVPEVVERGEPVVQAAVAAEDVPDATAYGDGVAGHVVAEHPGGAGRRQEQGVEHLDGGRLAGAVGPQEAEQLPGATSKVTPRTASVSVRRDFGHPVLLV